MTTFPAQDRHTITVALLRAFDDDRGPLAQLDAALSARQQLDSHIGSLIDQARSHGAGWDTIAAVLNVDEDEAVAEHAGRIIDEARHNPGFDGAGAWNRLGER